jgi:hypothetical protein
MALEHWPAALAGIEMLRAVRDPTKAAACSNFQPGDVLATTVADLPPVPPTCPACYAIVHPGATANALAAMEV